MLNFMAIVYVKTYSQFYTEIFRLSKPVIVSDK